MSAKHDQPDAEQAILAAARNIFLQKGFSGARMQEIADKAGINKALLHYYFRNKQQLFDTILLNNLEVIAPTFIETLSGKGAVVEKFGRLVDSYIDVILDHPDIPLFIMTELSRKRHSAINYLKLRMEKNKALTTFMEEIRAEQASGKLHRVPPGQMILSVLSLLIFPFIARPIFQHIMEIDMTDYNDMMEQRRMFIKDMITRSFVKDK